MVEEEEEEEEARRNKENNMQIGLGRGGRWKERETCNQIRRRTKEGEIKKKLANQIGLRQKKEGERKKTKKKKTL